MDHVYKAFLERQYEEAMALAEESDLIEVLPGGGRPPDKYIVRFFCKGLTHTGSEVVEAENFAVGIWMPSDYLRRVDPFHAVSWLSPENIYHPTWAGGRSVTQDPSPSVSDKWPPGGSGRSHLSGVRDHYLQQGDDARG